MQFGSERVYFDIGRLIAEMPELGCQTSDIEWRLPFIGR